MALQVYSNLRSFFDRNDRCQSALTVTLMLILTEAVYMRPGILTGTRSLLGSDYEMLHRWRLAFARRFLLGVRHTLPAWNPHEVMGAPFAANLQSFPWIPTRLVLLSLDPSIAFAVGVAISAALAAVFTYLYCRRAGLTRIAAAVAGWTFACGGYFASRVMAGHLPLLEAYPALPLLLWLVDRALAPERDGRLRFDLTALAVCCTCVVLAGHPQIPAYALAASFLYVAWRGRGVRAMLRVRIACAMALGVGMAMAAWWPMLKLIGRSTRILHLAAPDNDVVMPYSRLLALIVPGIHGWASPMDLADKHPFTGYLNNSYFWDTASYVGILPLLAVVALLVACIQTRRMPDWRWRFLAWLGAGAFVCSLPVAGPLLHLLPGTILRSPARMLYMSTFCAAVALGAGMDSLRRLHWRRNRRLVPFTTIALLILHFSDLYRFDRGFVQTYPRDESTMVFQTILDREAGSSRIAEERDDTVFADEDRYDDAGGFDSIFLARFNRGYLALAGKPADTNEQLFDASMLPVKALEALGVRFVITTDDRTDLKQVASNDDGTLFQVAAPAPRADFFTVGRVEFAPEQNIPELFAAGSWNRLLLEPDARKYLPHGGVIAAAGPEKVEYARPSGDEIDLRLYSAAPGFVHVLESYDPGWTATVDRANTVVLPANGFTLAIPVEPGSHAVRLRYETVGRRTGLALSVASLSLLVGLIAAARSGSSKRRTEQTSA